MRSIFSIAGCGIAVAALCAAPGRADAQSFFQKLFGIGSPSPQSRPSPPVPSLRSFHRFSPYGSGDWRYYSFAPQSGWSSGLYRTLCVRTCDGYYWPISPGTPRSRFHEDAKRCEASCNSEAKLFYLPRGSDDVASMIDLSGRSYGRLVSAFGYRKSLIAGCSCRPMPWSQAERARHQHYALVEKLERERNATVEVAAAAWEVADVAEDGGSGPNVRADVPRELSAHMEAIEPADRLTEGEVADAGSNPHAPAPDSGLAPGTSNVASSSPTVLASSGALPLAVSPAPAGKRARSGASKRTRPKPSASFASFVGTGGGIIWPSDQK